jgi:hypothetical protein
MTLSGSQSASTTTDAGGNYTLSAAGGGNYTVSPSFFSYTFSPQSLPVNNLNANLNGMNFAVTGLSAATAGTPVTEATPTSAPAITPPAPVSASVPMCGDISNTWTIPGTINSMTLNQSGSSVSGTGAGTSTYRSCHDGVCVVTGSCATGLNYSISGSSTVQGSFGLTAVSSSTDNCGVQLTVVDQETLSATLTSCTALSVTTASTTVPTGSPMRPELAQAPTIWTATSNPPGITLTVDIMAGTVNTQLTGRKTDNLTVTVYNSQGSQAFTPISHPSQQATQANQPISDKFRTLLPVGQYGSVTATWGTTGSVTVPVAFYMLGLTHFTQYNTPYHSQCTASPQFVWVVDKIDSQLCHLSGFDNMGTQFINAAGGDLNGTGVDDVNGTGLGTVLKAYYAGAGSLCPLLPGTDANHTFYSVDTGGNSLTKIIGSHWGTDASVVLSDASGPGPGSTALNNYNPQPGSVATDPLVTNTGGSLYVWGDAILVFDQNDNNDPRLLRSVQDLCKGCKGQGTQTPNAHAHIDMYNGTSQSCSAGAVGDYGTGQYFAIRLR